MKTPIFVTGMFRSGTTLIARLLNMHPHIAFASDTYQPTLKAFRNAVARDLFADRDLNPGAPLDDYYFDSDKIALMQRIQATPLDRPIGDLSLPDLREQTAAYCKEFSPRLLDHLDAIQGKTFTELLATGFAAVDRAYGDAGTKATGFKITWSDEFVPHVLAAFPEARAIEIIRDPRAVCASKKASPVGMYPWLFLARQWRKLMTLAWMHTQNNAVDGDRVLIVRYEDLVSEPRREMQRICDFLGLDFRSEVSGAENLVDGEGNLWAGNSSHFELTANVSSGSLDKWRDILSRDEVALIELLCYPEMKVFGYPLAEVDSYVFPAELVLTPPEIPADRLAGWIRDLVGQKAQLHREMALEHWRCGVLTGDPNVSDDIKSACCLYPQFFEAARAAI